MAKQTVGLGSSANDGTGDSLRIGGDKINDNFDELYTAIGTGTALNITTAGASSNQILQWSTSNNRFEPTASAAAGDISVDTTPQLGGDLDVNGNKIISASNGDIELIPHGTGKIKLLGDLKGTNAIGADVGFVEIESDKGHDSFLLNVPEFLSTLKNFLEKSYSNN